MVADERRAEIIAVAERLFNEKGYGNTSIADIIVSAGIAKGTFYHHFSSKTELAEGVVNERIETLRPLYDNIAARSDLSAVERLQALFDASSTWKQANIEFMVSTVLALYRDENALVLKRMFQSSIRLFGPYLNEVIREGVAAGEMQLPYTERFGEFLLGLFVGVGESQAHLVSASLEQPRKLYEYAEMIEMLEYSINRLLGLSEGTINLGAQSVIDQITAYLENKGV